MHLYLRETICLLILILLSIVFAGLHSSPPRISRPPIAKPFFNENSVVIDFYKGQMSSMIEQASLTDVSFIMYYAPWDAESQIIRNEFEIVAEYYHKQIFFAAINCWHPGSECRAQYSKIQSYPVLVVYPSKGPGVQYKGINTAPYIIRYLDGFLNPIRRISTTKDLSNLLLESESVFVGFIDFNGLSTSPGYREFYKTAIKTLEKDPNRDTIFAIVTDKQTSIREFNIEQFPSGCLYLWNESLIYPNDKLWTSVNIIKWIDTSLHKVITWLQPPGIKSLTLAPYLHDGPVLFLFTPRNPYFKKNFNYNLIREIALEYYNCDDDIWPKGLVQLLKIKRRNINPNNYDKKINECINLLSKINDNNDDDDYQQNILPIQKWINDSCCSKIFMNKCLSCESTGSMINDVCKIKKNYQICSKNDVFNIINNENNINKHYCCDDYHNDNIKNHQNTVNNKKLKISMLPNENDTKSAIQIEKYKIKENCQRLIVGDNYYRTKLTDESLLNNDKLNIELTASACSTNRSLAFIAVDSLHYYHFAEGLGIDILKMKDKTSVIIIDSLQESQYQLSKNLTRNTLVKFLNNYSNGLLKRTLRSDSSRRYARDFKSSKKCSNNNNSNSMNICIPELTTDTFLPTILDNNKNVIVFYHSPYCAFCSAISYVYLTVAHYLSSMNNLYFVRIDGDNNDLPWEYSMNRYPSILFFPAKRKEDSTVYPFSLPITISNLLNFILQNLNNDLRIEALIHVCHKGAGVSPINCILKIRHLCIDTIQSLLIKHRKLLRYKLTNNLITKKRINYIKLDFIRDIHLILNSVNDLSNNDKYNLLINKFSNYYSNLKSIESNKNTIIVKDEL
ncbi:hypothetical protein HCN44_005857 [Aphidius gifuensis]|uniref:Thioredoxin domain-containing protein n=2 Tax=Aphidius gifuensis TaxID=684658 RepID=A0A834XYC6_APHGI|nr:hypothetical protein HCN44_005857 [Aphidius gifuensis]